MLSGFIDVLFPPRCAACRELLPPADDPAAIGDLCALCESTLEPIESGCARCGMPGEPSRRCGDCFLHPPAFDGAMAAFRYGAAMSDLLQRFKYEDHPELAKPLGAAVAALDLPDTDLVVPVPLHASRRRARTYDQALYLARDIARRRGWRCDPRLLQRVRPTPRQVGQHRSERERNVRGAFAVTGSVRGARILLVDDVVTTGATASECARVLRKAGARSVHVASVARAV